MIDVRDIISVDVESYFNDFISFVSKYQQTITDYYTQQSSYPKEALDKLSELVKNREKIYEDITSHRDLFNEFKYFEILDSLEDSFHILDIFQNYSRWLRSSVVNGKFKESIEVNIILRQNQTLENLSSELGFEDQDQGALEVALRNNLKEGDYSLEGQNLVFKFGYQNQDSLTLNSVVDNLLGENIVGKDLQRKLELSIDDLVTLTPQQTFEQTCDIILGLRKRDNPEFPDIGFDKSLLVNRNILNSTLPSFIRQLYTIVDRDDTIASFQISKVDTSQDVLTVEVIFRSWLGNEVKQYTSNGN